MKTLKKALALILSTMMLLSMMTVMSSAATPSVTRQSLAGAVVTVPSVTYNGKDQTAKVTSVTLAGKVLTENADYTVQPTVAKNAGSYTVTVAGIGLYDGTATGVFTINPKSLSGATVKLNKTSVKYTGKNIAKTIKVASVKLDGVTLKKGTDFSVEKPDTAKATGKYTVKVIGQGNYTGSAKATFTITASNKKTPTLTVTARKSTVKSSGISKKDFRNVITIAVDPKGDKGKVTISVDTPKGGKSYIAKSVKSQKQAVVRFKKGAPKGTYAVTITKAAYNSCKKVSETIYIEVK